MKKLKKINWKKLIGIIVITIIIGGLFSFFLTDSMKDFKKLSQPKLSPPGITFMIVWPILYILMGISAYMVSESDSKEVYKEKALKTYWWQLVLNSIWTLIFFGLKWRLVAFIVIIALIVLVILMIKEFYDINKIAGLLQLPYLIWLLFASYLNIAIYILNG